MVRVRLLDRGGWAVGRVGWMANCINRAAACVNVAEVVDVLFLPPPPGLDGL